MTYSMLNFDHGTVSRLGIRLGLKLILRKISLEKKKIQFVKQKDKLYKGTDENNEYLLA